MAEQVEPDVRQGAKAAAAAAAVGAAVGVARALASRHHDEDEQEEPADTVEVEPEHETESEEQEPEHEREPERREGAGVGELRRITAHARELLQELSGVEIESVSGVDRLRGGWRVTVEAVEVRRIPDSTDVLASYEVELDGDGELVRYERLRRYARSQSDHGGRG